MSLLTKKWIVVGAVLAVLLCLGVVFGRPAYRKFKERAVRQARASYAVRQTNSAVVSTYAPALHSEGKTAEGLQLMHGIPEAELRRPGVALYYGVLLAASGELEKAQPYLAAAEKRKPLPEEAELLEQAKIRTVVR